MLGQPYNPKGMRIFNTNDADLIEIINYCQKQGRKSWLVKRINRLGVMMLREVMW